MRTNDGITWEIRASGNVVAIALESSLLEEGSLSTQWTLEEAQTFHSALGEVVGELDSRHKAKKVLQPKDGIHRIRPYLWGKQWVFDDSRVGLKKEALVAGTDRFVLDLAEEAEVLKPERGFVLEFSEFPVVRAWPFSWVREESGGNVYQNSEGEEGWLCPALLRYFQTPPSVIYARALEEPGNELRSGDLGLLGTKWVPKNQGEMGLPWKVTDVSLSGKGRVFVQLEKYCGGQNSPAILTIKKLRKKFRLADGQEGQVLTEK